MSIERSLRVLLLASIVLPADANAAATITIDNVNAAGVGFNDSTAAAPVGGNTGTTRGQQRLIVFQQAAAQWGALLNSSVAIKVKATMEALACSASGATLGSAGALSLWADFPNRPRADTAYTVAEANSFAGFDLDPAGDDIQAKFNVTLDDGNASCLNGTKWWYGINPNIVPSAGTIPLLPVVFHELGHGLGFSAQTDTGTGNFLTPSDPPIWSNYLFDVTTQLLWKNMSSAQRLTSLTNDPGLVWVGPRTNKQAHAWLKQSTALIINSPPSFAGAQEVGTAQFGPSVPAAGVTGDLVYVNDGVIGAGMTPGTLHDGCETPYSVSVTGKIALIDNGYCSFTTKVKKAQTQGAIAVIIANNAIDPFRLPLVLTGSDATITIPSSSINQALGQELASSVQTVNAKLGYANIGLNDDCVRMFAPNPVLTGSSVSHFHADALPNLLMEPSLNTSIFDKVDLTLPLFADIDWSTNSEEFIFLDGLDLNPCPHVP
jgi:hypothetical protein